MSRPRVLLADDSPTIRAVMGGELDRLGHDVLSATDGHEALAVLRTQRPDVALLDIEMPGLDGLGVLRAMRAEEELANIPVVFLTGRVSAEDVSRGLREGAHDYLRKPVEPSELAARLHVALRTARLEAELRERNEALRRLACTDHLTGLYNRRVVTEELARHVSLARRHERALSAALLDIDHFKAINDTHGHETGDAALVGIARRVAGRLRTDDLVGRWGGEEFLAIFPETGGAGALTVAEDLRRAVAEQPLAVDGEPIGLTVSVGVATLADGEGPDELLRRADAAMYAAKSSGRDAVRAAEPAGPG